MFGPTALAEDTARRLRHVHGLIRGVTTEGAGRFPAGTPYRGDDPDLLLWILAALADSAMLVYSKYVRRLDRDARDALWRDYRVVGGHFGLAGDEIFALADLCIVESDLLAADGVHVELAGDEMPDTIEAFDHYMDAMLESGDLLVTPQARELAVDIVLRPPVPLRFRPLLELVNQVTVGLLPGSIRRMYGFSWDPLRAAALHGGAEYVKRVLVPVLPEHVRTLPVARAA